MKIIQDIEKKEIDFNYNYFHPYFMVLIKEYNEESIRKTTDILFYDENNQLRQIHKKYIDKYFHHYDSNIPEIYYRMLEDPCVDYYIGKTYDLYYNLPMFRCTKDDINIGTRYYKYIKGYNYFHYTHISKNIVYSKDDILYYKHKSFYKSILDIPTIYDIMTY